MRERINEISANLEMLSAEIIVLSRDTKNARQRIKELEIVVQQSQIKEKKLMKITSAFFCLLLVVGGIALSSYSEQNIPANMKHTAEIALIISKGMSLTGFLGGVTIMFGKENKIVSTVVENLFG
jgi:predicted small integral membrane protein